MSAPAAPARGFFDSRWVEAPAHARETAGFPAAFRGSGLACGVKPSGRPDLALIVCDEPGVASAARFTRSGTQAPPVRLCVERCELGALRAVVANSGNANAATGRPGFEAAAKVQGAGALVAGAPEAAVAVASTGVIGVPLPVDAVLGGLREAAGTLSADGDVAVAEAIMSTDAFPKRASLEVDLPGGPVRLAAQCKGAGMISPAFATLLCFVQTDARMSAETAELLLRVTTMRSFERISVDGQLSTSDTVVLQASGAAGVEVAPRSEDERLLGEALDALLRQLALLCVRDGEGAERVGRILVRGGHELHVQGVARAVADSPLVKTALHGGDPNWGRIVQAVGQALPGTAPLDVGVAIEGVELCRGGVKADFDEAALAAAVAREEVEYEVKLPGEGFEAEVFFSDLGHGYVTLNAEYTT